MACVTLAAAGGLTLIVTNACAPTCSAQALVRSANDPAEASAMPTATAVEPTAGGAAEGIPTAQPNAPLDQLLQRVDGLRVRAGCQTWTRSTVLDRTAQAQAATVAKGGVSHVDGTGGTALDRAHHQGYQGNVIEIVAQGTLNPDEFSAAFVRIANQSDVLNCRFRAVGAAESRRHLVIVLGDR